MSEFFRRFLREEGPSKEEIERSKGPVETEKQERVITLDATTIHDVLEDLEFSRDRYEKLKEDAQWWAPEQTDKWDKLFMDAAVIGIYGYLEDPAHSQIDYETGLKRMLELIPESRQSEVTPIIKERAAIVYEQYFKQIEKYMEVSDDTMGR